MKILALSYLYPNSLYPHYGIFVHNRLKAVSKYHDVKVINPIPWFPGCGRLARYKDYDKIPQKETLDGIEVFHPRFLVIPRYWKFIDAFTYRAVVMPLAERLRNDFLFDLIDLHWTYPDLPTGTALKRKYGKKMVVTLRGKEAFHIGEGAIRERLITKNLLQADAVIGLSQELVDMAVARGVNPNHCHVVRNGVDTTRFCYIDKEDCREKLGLPLEEKIILSVGSLTYGKGFDRIINSLPMILKYYPSSKLYIIGTEGPAGDYKKRLFQLIHEKKVSGNVTFVGKVDNKNLVYWYNSADVFCLASRSEGCPNVLLEALACGCPSVATDVGTIREIIEQDSMGVLIKNTTNDVHYGLIKALQSHWSRKKIYSIMIGCNWDRCANLLNPVINNVLDN
jgi:glycosyltransferase involved in cell wall biosynthesis